MLPMNAEAHERRLRERNTYTEFEIKLAMERVEVYAEHNRNNAGFFDMMINCGLYLILHHNYKPLKKHLIISLLNF